MTKLVLVRHGQTDWNVEGRYQGQADPPLNATGRAQARAAAEKLSARRFGAVYSSDLQRARETADAIAEQAGLPVSVDPRLREIHQGVWDGMLTSQIKAQYPDEWAARQRDPERPPPGGEPASAVAQRVRAAADDLARAHPEGTAVVVSHGFALATLLCRARGLPLSEAASLIPDNADPIEIDWPPRP